MAKTYTAPKGIDIVRVLKKYLKNWFLFAVAIIIALLYARDSNKYIEPIYSLNTSLLIENKSNKSVLEERGAISENPLYLGQKLIENQIAYLKSYGFIKTIVKKMDIMVSYYKRDKFYWKDIYTETPFLIEFDPELVQIRHKLLIIEFSNDSTFLLSSEEYIPFTNKRKYRIGELIVGQDFNFRVKLKHDKTVQDIENKTYAFKINDINSLTGEYRGKTNVFIQKNTSILVIGTSGSNKQKEKDYLNMVTKVFLETNLDKKNEILTNTITFINSQLLSIGAELDTAEQRLEDFRKNHKFMELRSKAAALLRKLDSQSKSKSNLLLDLKYYEYLLDYLLTHDQFEDIVMPSTVGLSLPLFSDLVLKLSTVSLEKEDLIANSSRENPYIVTLEEEISNTKTALKENMRSIIATTNIKIADMEDRIMFTNDEFLRLPSIEREFLEIQRKYKVFNTLYDFLLKRKSEVEIQRAANLSDHEVFDRAGDTGISIISKSPKSTYINALVYAILIPSIFLFLLVFLNDRVMGEDDIRSISDLPIIGSVTKSSNKELAVPNSYFAENLRLIRIKLNILVPKGEQVILITSSTMEEGKSFISQNLAKIYSMTGKRTLFLGFDLRRPTSYHEWKIDGDVGFSDFMTNNTDLSKSIQKTDNDNLDILISGPILPNPDEIIDSQKTGEMFSYLRSNYQYIIVDSPAHQLINSLLLLVDLHFLDICMMSPEIEVFLPC